MTEAQPEEARRLLESAVAPGEGLDTFGAERLEHMKTLLSTWLETEDHGRESRQKKPTPSKARKAAG